MQIPVKIESTSFKILEHDVSNSMYPNELNRFSAIVQDQFHCSLGSEGIALSHESSQPLSKTTVRRGQKTREAGPGQQPLLMLLGEHCCALSHRVSVQDLTSSKVNCSCIPARFRRPVQCLSRQV